MAVQPFEVLDELFSGDQQSHRNGIRLLDTLRQFRRSPMDGLSDERIIEWCDRNPAVNYPLAAAISLLFKRPSEKAPMPGKDQRKDRAIDLRIVPTSSFDDALLEDVRTTVLPTFQVSSYARRS